MAIPEHVPVTGSDQCLEILIFFCRREKIIDVIFTRYKRIYSVLTDTTSTVIPSMTRSPKVDRIENWSRVPPIDYEPPPFSFRPSMDFRFFPRPIKPSISESFIILKFFVTWTKPHRPCCLCAYGMTVDKIIRWDVCALFFRRTPLCAVPD